MPIGSSAQQSLITPTIPAYVIKYTRESLIKCLLTRIGAYCSRQTIHKLNAALNYLEVGRWINSMGFEPTSRVYYKSQIFELLAKEIGHKAVLYLEFGVFQGELMRYWSSMLDNRRTFLHGFDTFEGLPEEWNLSSPKGHFSTNGCIPRIDDPRIEFFKGRFEDTLPRYVAPPHEVLIINMDADLYSSTVFVLNALHALIVPGAYIYFDEFSDRLHELRAFDEFIRKFGFRFRLRCATRALHNVLFQRVA